MFCLEIHSKISGVTLLQTGLLFKSQRMDLVDTINQQIYLIFTNISCDKCFTLLLRNYNISKCLQLFILTTLIKYETAIAPITIIYQQNSNNPKQNELFTTMLSFWLPSY